MDHPISSVYMDTAVARAAAALPGGGAYDATPLELDCPGFQKVTLFFLYTRGGAGGAFAFRPELNPSGGTAAYYQATLYAPANVVAGVDSQSDVQREAVEYQATGAAQESFVYGPLELGGACEHIRIPCAETGNVGAPGTLAINAVFSM